MVISYNVTILFTAKSRDTISECYWFDGSIISNQNISNEILNLPAMLNVANYDLNVLVVWGLNALI